PRQIETVRDDLGGTRPVCDCDRSTHREWHSNAHESERADRQREIRGVELDRSAAAVFHRVELAYPVAKRGAARVRENRSGQRGDVSAETRIALTPCEHARAKSADPKALCGQGECGAGGIGIGCVL